MPSGASTAVKKKKTYSAADCEVIQNASVDSSKGSGGFGKEAKAVADAFNAAGGEVKDKTLKKSLKNLASFYVEPQQGQQRERRRGPQGQGRARPTPSALKEYLNATAYCVSQITVPPVTAPTVTTPTTSSSSTTSTSSASDVHVHVDAGDHHHDHRLTASGAWLSRRGRAGDGS